MMKTETKYYLMKQNFTGNKTFLRVNPDSLEKPFGYIRCPSLVKFLRHGSEVRSDASHYFEIIDEKGIRGWVKDVVFKDPTSGITYHSYYDNIVPLEE